MSQRFNNLRLSCPHCGEFARLRGSERLTATYREAVIECQSIDCCWRGKLTLEMTHTVTPSLAPDPKIRLPFTAQARDSIRVQLGFDFPM